MILRDKLQFGQNPYGGFPHTQYQPFMDTYYSDHPIFEALIMKTQPKLIIEVGTWYGGSAIHMAKLIKRFGLQTEIGCVDTFLGSLECWGGGELKYDPKFLRLKYGLPQFYYQFLANVVYAGVQDIITPLPMTSEIAAALLLENKIQADMVYVDASHNYSGVIRDMDAYWPVVKPGGFMFGDDFALEWHGVVRAVSEWADKHSFPVLTIWGPTSVPSGEKVDRAKWYFPKL
jgi:SAM-dependent methyltransferase